MACAAGAAAGAAAGVAAEARAAEVRAASSSLRSCEIWRPCSSFALRSAVAFAAASAAARLASASCAAAELACLRRSAFSLVRRSLPARSESSSVRTVFGSSMPSELRAEATVPVPGSPVTNAANTCWSSVIFFIDEASLAEASSRALLRASASLALLA